ncbi:MAG: hypothetical protein V4773_24250 [Verrucomicrobiota bacterium]
MKLRTFLRPLLMLIVSSSALTLPAAPLEHDLGQGLRLYRIHALPADLPATAPAEGKAAPCVVDLRYVQTEAEGATAFEAWLRFRAKPRTPVFVLANSDTSSSLLRSLAQREVGGGIVLVGVPSRQLKPDVAVRASGGDEKRAYEALERGVPLAALLTDNPDKVRNDEASLSRDRLAEASADAAADALGQKVEGLTVDLALQRAVHLHRALVALKKL